MAAPAFARRDHAHGPSDNAAFGGDQRDASRAKESGNSIPSYGEMPNMHPDNIQRGRWDFNRLPFSNPEKNSVTE